MVADLVPGEILTADGDIELTAGAIDGVLAVTNSGDHPVQTREMGAVPLSDRREVSGFQPKTMGGL